MNGKQREFLDSLLSTPSPSGFETNTQKVWIRYVSKFADEVHTDEYGNAVAVHKGSADSPKIAFTGHSDEIGFIVRDIIDGGYLRINCIGGSDRTVSQGQHVTIHTTDGPVQGVIGQTAIHLRETGEEEYTDIAGQFVDIGAADTEEAESIVEIGDPITFSTETFELHESRLSARGIDNSVGIWSAAEGLRRSVESDVEATIYAVSTVQEEVGLKGAQMVGFDLDPDAAIAVDVTHATENPDVSGKHRGPVELGEGPVICRGSANHERVVDMARQAAQKGGVDTQIQATGSYTGTDADAFYTSRSGIPSLNIGIPNRYMHTPVEVIDTDDLEGVAKLLDLIAEEAGDVSSFSIDL